MLLSSYQQTFFGVRDYLSSFNERGRLNTSNNNCRCGT